MVFAPVDPTIKEKVLSAYLAGHGRNQITHEMHGLGIKVSHGSISNIINAYKRKHEQPSQPQVCRESQTSNADISTGVNINDTSSSLLMTFHDSGTGQAVTITNNSNVVTPRNGAPLSHLLGEDTSTDEEEIISVSVTPYSNSPSPVVPVLTPPKQEPFPSKDLFIKDPDSQDVLEEESEEQVGGLSAQEIESSKPKVRDTSDSIKGAETSVLVEKSIHDKLEQERIAWDYYGSAWMGILKQIRREKDQQRHELLVIDRRKQKLSEWKKRLEQMQYDLTARETRILESECFLPLARQLEEMKLALEDALPWIETIREKAEAENVDIRTTAINVAQELRLYRQSGGIQKQIERGNQELALVNMATIQKQQALTVLIDLLNRGVTESQIVQLINFAGEWNKYWDSSKTNSNLQRPVNGSNNPGSSDGNFSVNDLIRLNLLKSTTTNMLNRMETNRNLQ